MNRQIPLLAAAPLTLMQLLGVPNEPARLDNATLVIVDAQGEYRDGVLALDGIDAAAQRLSDLLTRARAAGTPVLHITQRGVPGGLFDPDGPRGAILAEARPRTGEAVIVKPAFDAFVGTDLAERLAATGRHKIILAGFQTHLCVDATARDAVVHGFAVTIAADATATRVLPGSRGDAAQPAATIQKASLAALADGFAVVVPAADIH